MVSVVSNPSQLLLDRDALRKAADPVALAALVAANLVPLVGVLFFGWDVLNIALLYWFENLVVAVYAALRMLKAGGVKAVPLVLFFAVHFGGFCVGHVIFLMVLFSDIGGLAITGAPAPPAESSGLANLLAIAALFVSHGISFVRNYIGKGQYKTAEPGLEMFKPYPRMIVLHVAIILGAWVVMAIGSNVGFLALLVLMKLGLDLGVHLIGHGLRAVRPALDRATNPAEATPNTPPAQQPPSPQAGWPSQQTTRLP